MRYQRVNNFGEEKEEKEIDQIGVLKRLFPQLWPADWWTRIQIIVSFVLLLGSKFMDLLVPLAMKYAVDDLTNGNVPTGPIILYGVFRFAGELTLEIRNVIYSQISATLEKKVASDLFAHLQKLSLRFHLDRKTGAVLRSVSRGSSAFAEAGRIILFQFFPVILQVLLVCGYLVSEYDYYFALTTFATISIYLAFTLITTNWRTKFRKEMNEKDNDFNQRAIDALLNFETVKYFCAEEHEQRRYETALQAYRDSSVKVQQSLSVLNLGQNLIVSTGVVIVMALAGQKCVSGQLSFGDFILVNQFILTLYSPLEYLGSYYRALTQYITDIDAMFQLLNEDIEIQDDPDAPNFVPQKGEVVFDNVSFSYDPAYPILKEVSFRVEPGQRAAIVGPSGAGKSTIARLLYRFYDVQNGEIRIDGQAVTRVTQRSVRSNIAIVPQDTVLFNDTIGYNIGYGAVALGHEATTEEIDHAAESASLTSFISSKDDGYSIRVGERGLRLSGGEKQRVGIARALLKHPLLFIFDEATSSLDTHTEREIQSSLESISKGYTSITIAHRLSTIMNSDVIFVLKAGQIVERGTHAELLQLGKEYSSLWRKQEETKEIEQQISKLQSKAQFYLKDDVPSNDSVVINIEPTVTDSTSSAS